MRQTETDATPFPPNFAFQDVDQTVLEREETDAPLLTAPGAWQSYMSKMLTRGRQPQHA